MSFCTLPLCQSGSGSPHSLRTRTERRRWPAGRSTSGCYTPDKGPDPGAAHNEGPGIQLLNIDKKKGLQDYIYFNIHTKSTDISPGYLLLLM